MVEVGAVEAVGGDEWAGLDGRRDGGVGVRAAVEGVEGDAVLGYEIDLCVCGC